MSESYLPTHEWARQEGDLITIGLSPSPPAKSAKSSMSSCPPVGDERHAGKPCAEIESVKSVNDYYSPIDGTVVAINESLREHAPSRSTRIRWAPAGSPRCKARRRRAPGRACLSTADYQARLTT
jgi:hypothetical protein